MTCGGTHGTDGNHLAVFSKDIACAYHFVASHMSLSSHPIRVLVVLAASVEAI